MIHPSLLLSLLFHHLHQPCVYKLYKKLSLFKNESHRLNKETQNCPNRTFFDATAALSACIFHACNILFNWFFNYLLNVLSSFGGAPTPSLPSSLPPVTAKTMVEKTIFTNIKFAAMVITCSLNRVGILLAIGVSESSFFSMACLLLVTRLSRVF